MYCIVLILYISLQRKGVRNIITQHLNTDRISNVNKMAMLNRSVIVMTLMSFGWMYGMGAQMNHQEIDPTVEQTVNPESAETSVDSIPGYDYADLDEFVVIANKKVIQVDGSNVTYNVAEDTSSDGLSALDMLRKVPYVTVDGEDNIRIKGSSGFKVLINGHENTAMSSNLSKILKSMPASGIEKIEVINEPDAKYDAEGVAGILNIVLNTKEKEDAYSVGVELSYSFKQAALSASGRIKKDKFSADATVTFANVGKLTLKDKIDTESKITYLDSDTYHLMLQRLEQNFGYNYLSVGTNMSYEYDSKNLVTANLFYNDISMNFADISSISEMFDAQGNLKYSFRSLYNGSPTFGTLSVGGAYEHDFSNDKMHRLSVAYQYNRGTSKFGLGYNNTDIYNYDNIYNYSESVNDNYNNEHTVQLDYVNNFNTQKHLMEAGAKFVFRRNDAFGTQRAGVSSADSEIVEETELTQKQDIYAAYASYTYKNNHLSAKGGLRYEHTAMGIDYKIGVIPDFMKYLNDLVPNVSATWMFGPTSNMRLAYIMRITRPDLASVNPYQMQITPVMASRGNPDLGCETANKVSLGYSNFGRIFGVSLNIEYSQTDNAIVSAMINEGQLVVDTKLNDGKIKVASLSGFINANITSTMNLSVSGNVNHASYRYQFGSNKGWQGNVNCNYAASLWADIRLNMYAGFGSKSYNFIGHSGPYHYYGIGISRTFLKNKSLKIGLNANNCFEGHQVYSSYSASNNVITSNRTLMRSWNVGFSIGWNIGGLTEGAKKSSILIENDDVVKSKSSGTGGIVE